MAYDKQTSVCFVYKVALRGSFPERPLEDLGVFGTKINNIGISNAVISVENSNAGFNFIKCLIHCFSPHLMFRLKFYKKNFSPIIPLNYYVIGSR